MKKIMMTMMRYSAVFALAAASALSLLVMLTMYGEAEALVPAVVAMATFAGAVYLTIETK